jgi:hypothetical protein
MNLFGRAKFSWNFAKKVDGDAPWTQRLKDVWTRLDGWNQRSTIQ